MRAAAATLLALLALAAPASAKTETASSGAVRAELSYTERSDRAPTDIELRVLRDGEEIVRKALPDDRFLLPLAGGAVVTRDLDGDGEAEALFSLFTGGAHCCVLTYLFDGTDEIEENWGNPGYALRDFQRDGVPEFETADDAFNYRYSSYASSLPPLKVLRLVDGKLVDVTREPAMRPALRTEAARYKRIYQRFRPRARKDPILREVLRSSLAGHAADQCSLGACAKGYALIRAAQRRGDVIGFLRTVRRDLRRLGYDDR